MFLKGNTTQQQQRRLQALVWSMSLSLFSLCLRPFLYYPPSLTRVRLSSCKHRRRDIPNFVLVKLGSSKSALTVVEKPPEECCPSLSAMLLGPETWTKPWKRRQEVRGWKKMLACCFDSSGGVLWLKMADDLLFNILKYVFFIRLNRRRKGVIATFILREHN